MHQSRESVEGANSPVSSGCKSVRSSSWRKQHELRSACPHWLFMTIVYSMWIIRIKAKVSLYIFSVTFLSWQFHIEKHTEKLLFELIRFFAKSLKNAQFEVKCEKTSIINLSAVLPFSRPSLHWLSTPTFHANGAAIGPLGWPSERAPALGRETHAASSPCCSVHRAAEGIGVCASCCESVDQTAAAPVRFSSSRAAGIPGRSSSRACIG